MKSTSDIRHFLLDQMTLVASGEADLNATKGISNLAQQVYNTMNMELKVATAKAKYENLDIRSIDFSEQQ